MKKKDIANKPACQANFRGSCVACGGLCDRTNSNYKSCRILGSIKDPDAFGHEVIAEHLRRVKEERLRHHQLDEIPIILNPCDQYGPTTELCDLTGEKCRMKPYERTDGCHICLEAELGQERSHEQGLAKGYGCGPMAIKKGFAK